MKIIFTGLTSLVCICLLSQFASGFEPKTSLPNTALVVLSGCDASYLVKDCNTKEKITRTKSYAINLKESLSMDSNDKKPKDTKTKETKPAKTTKDVKKKPEKSKKLEPKKLDKDLKKKFEKIIKAKKTTAKSTQKTKHNTVKNSISNIR